MHDELLGGTGDGVVVLEQSQVSTSLIRKIVKLSDIVLLPHLPTRLTIQGSSSYIYELIKSI